MSMDFGTVFSIDTPIVEIFLRGTVTYLFIFVLLRVVLRRQRGAVSTSDLLVTVLIADAAQNAMADDYKSITDGLILVATIVFWSFFLDWAEFRFPVVGRLLEAKAVVVIKDGQFLHEQLKREFLTEQEVLSQMREQGIENIASVRRARVEQDGRMSFIVKTGFEPPNHPAPSKGNS